MRRAGACRQGCLRISGSHRRMVAVEMAGQSPRWGDPIPAIFLPRKRRAVAAQA